MPDLVVHFYKIASLSRLNLLVSMLYFPCVYLFIDMMQRNNANYVLWCIINEMYKIK